MTNICLLHGWGMNRVVWRDIEDFYGVYGRVKNIDLPGYGARSGETFPTNLDLLAKQMVSEIPAGAVVIAWSLGATLAIYMQLARLVPIHALQLVSATPKFVNSSDWNAGQKPEDFTNFLTSFKGDYVEAQRNFLSLQFYGETKNSNLVDSWLEALDSYPRPSRQTLINGLRLLQEADLRAGLGKLDIPVHIVSGKRDRVCQSKAAIYLHNSIKHSRLSELSCGHIPFYSRATEYKQSTKSWFESLGFPLAGVGAFQ